MHKAHGDVTTTSFVALSTGHSNIMHLPFPCVPCSLYCGLVQAASLPNLLCSHVSSCSGHSIKSFLNFPEYAWPHNIYLQMPPSLIDYKTVSTSDRNFFSFIHYLQVNPTTCFNLLIFTNWIFYSVIDSRD